MKIDRERLAAHISEMAAAVELLQGYRSKSRSDFLRDPLIVRDTKYNFIIAAQAGIDICYHVTAAVLKKAPEDYGNCFALIGTLSGILPETAAKMMIMARFRNLLVHHYIKVEDGRVYDMLSEIGCFADFLSQLENVIARE